MILYLLKFSLFAEGTAVLYSYANISQLIDILGVTIPGNLDWKKHIDHVRNQLLKCVGYCIDLRIVYPSEYNIYLYHFLI